MNAHDRTPLATHVAIFRRVKAEIAAEFGLDEDDQAVVDSAEGETDLAEYLAALLRTALDAQAQAAGLGELIKQRQERKARLQAKHDRLKGIVLHAMADAGLQKLAAPDFSASRSRAQAPLVVPDEAAVPSDFCRVKREVDKTKIRDAIKSGASFGFAYLGNPSEALTIRGT